MLEQSQAVAGAFSGAERVATPQVVVDVERLKKNIARPVAIVPPVVELHPHVKTHKSFSIARTQIGAGASGLTVSRPAEAAAFLRAPLGSRSAARRRFSRMVASREFRKSVPAITSFSTFQPCALA